MIKQENKLDQISALENIWSFLTNIYSPSTDNAMITEFMRIIDNYTEYQNKYYACKAPFYSELNVLKQSLKRVDKDGGNNLKDFTNAQKLLITDVIFLAKSIIFETYKLVSITVEFKSISNKDSSIPDEIDLSQNVNNGLFCKLIICDTEYSNNIWNAGFLYIYNLQSSNRIGDGLYCKPMIPENKTYDQFKDDLEFTVKIDSNMNLLKKTIDTEDKSKYYCWLMVAYGKPIAIEWEIYDRNVIII